MKQARDVGRTPRRRRTGKGGKARFVVETKTGTTAGGRAVTYELERVRCKTHAATLSPT